MSSTSSRSCGRGSRNDDPRQTEPGVSRRRASRLLPRPGDLRGTADGEIVDDVREKTAYALKAFPELAGKTVNVGRLDLDQHTGDPETLNGQAFKTNLLVTYPVDRPTSFITVYHELAHLAIGQLDKSGEDVPVTSEEFCSIFAVSRMPVGTIDEQRVPYLGRPSRPAEKWPEICQRAIEYREERGANSHYIQRAREWLEVGG